MSLGYCSYHQKEEELCKAHILPKAFFSKVLKLAKTEGLWLHEVGTGDVKRRPAGDYDQGILCREADRLIGDFDQYGVRFFGKAAPEQVLQVRGRLWVKRSRFNFEKLQLFLMSFAWRCHHSTLPQYAAISVGSRYEGLLRDALVKKDGSSKPWFSFFIVWLPTKLEENLLPLKYPFQSKIMGVNYFISYFLNFKVFMRIDQRTGPQEIEWLAPTDGTKISIPVLPYEESADFGNDLRSLKLYHGNNG